jgi:hypothetical protein
VSGVRTPDDPPDISPEVIEDFGLFIFYQSSVKFITSANTFTKSRKCHSAAHDGMAFFDAV